MLTASTNGHSKTLHFHVLDQDNRYHVGMVSGTTSEGIKCGSHSCSTPEISEQQGKHDGSQDICAKFAVTISSTLRLCTSPFLSAFQPHRGLYIMHLSSSTVCPFMMIQEPPTPSWHLGRVDKALHPAVNKTSRRVAMAANTPETDAI